MATAERILAIAQAELGVKESPAGSNKVKYNTWYYGSAVSGGTYPWCMAFVQWVFAQADAAALLPVRTASCGALMRAAQKAGLWVTKDYLPGDVVIYDFPGGGTTDHTGIVETATKTGVTAIEGNTSQGGSQSNGGEVCRKTRSNSLIAGAVRPKYQKGETAMNNTPSPAHKEGVEWAVKNGILTGDARGDLMLTQSVTRQQLCTILLRYAKWLGKA